MDEQQNIIIYRTADGRASVALFAKDGKIWLNQQQMAELFATSKPNISMHIANILKEKELNEGSVVKNFLTTAADGKRYATDCFAQDDIIQLVRVIPSNNPSSLLSILSNPRLTASKRTSTRFLRSATH